MVIAINNDTVSKRNTMFGYRIKKIYKAYLETGKEISITNKDQQDMRRKMLIPCFSIWRNQNARNLFL